MIIFIMLLPILGICACMLFGVYLYWQVISKLLSEDDKDDDHIRMENLQ